MIFQLDIFLNLFLNTLFVVKNFIFNNSLNSSPHTSLRSTNTYKSMINSRYNRSMSTIDVSLKYTKETLKLIRDTYGYVLYYKINKTTISLKGLYNNLFINKINFAVILITALESSFNPEK